MYNRREGLCADWARVFADAARLGKAVEIEGYSDRQDLRLSLLEVAHHEGVRISLGTDAHHPDQLAFMDLSPAAALFAEMPPERIVNFLALTVFKAWVAEVREDCSPSARSVLRQERPNCRQNPLLDIDLALAVRLELLRPCENAGAA